MNINTRNKVNDKLKSETQVISHYNLRPNRGKKCDSSDALNTKSTNISHVESGIVLQARTSKKKNKNVREKSSQRIISVNNENKQIRKGVQKISKQKTGLDDNVENESCNEKIFVSIYGSQSTSKQIKRTKNSRRDSFEKYGVLLPSYQKVLENKIKIENEAIALDAYEAEYGNHEISLLNTSQNSNHNTECSIEQDLLDCECLEDKELQEHFLLNLDYIKNIQNGSFESDRHKKFLNYDPSRYFTLQDLCYSPSTFVFNINQKDLMLKMLEDYFDPEGENTDYLFKVLLPELCLKIFMDVHEMNRSEAIDYLNWRPLE